MKEGSLDSLRDGTLQDLLSSSKKKINPLKHTTLPVRSHTKKSNPNSKSREIAQADKMDEDSDGGFFEEPGAVKISAN